MYKDEALFLLKGGKDGILEWNRKVAAGKANLDLGGSQAPGSQAHGGQPRGSQAPPGGPKLGRAHRGRFERGRI